MVPAATSYNMASKSHNLVLHPLRVPDVEPSKGDGSVMGLTEKEQVEVNILMDGGTKGEVAKALNCTPATANYYFKSIRKKFVLAGVSL